MDFSLPSRKFVDFLVVRGETFSIDRLIVDAEVEVGTIVIKV
jgi:hypothetical protein